jgi:RNA polymerase sigma-70 factor (ECF subfamily)
MTSPPLPDDGPAPDADLIAAWRGGDESAAAELVRRHGAAVARFLGAAGAGDDVDDLVQETFFRAFRRIEGYRGGASFRTWVIAIGSNALKDARRRLKRRPVIPLETEDIPDEHPDPHAELVGQELEERVAACVVRLPRMQRDVFLLRAQQGMEYDDIAVALRTSVGAARVHYHHALKRLKEWLE